MPRALSLGQATPYANHFAHQKLEVRSAAAVIGDSHVHVLAALDAHDRGDGDTTLLEFDFDLLVDSIERVLVQARPLVAEAGHVLPDIQEEAADKLEELFSKGERIGRDSDTRPEPLVVPVYPWKRT
jgi:hypothetical protein